MREERNKSHKRIVFLIVIQIVLCICASFLGTATLYASDYGEFSIPDGYFDFPLKGDYGLEATLNATTMEWSYGERGFAYPSVYQFRTIGDSHEFHDGVDIWAPEGTPVYAAADGQIAEVHVDGDDSETGFGNNCNDWNMGNHIIIQHDNGFYTVYCHLSSIEAGIYAGQNVAKGELIGYVGHTGRCVGPEGGNNPEGNHLHFAISHLNSDGYRQRVYENRTGETRDVLSAKYPKIFTHYGCINPLYCFGAECIAWANRYYVGYGNLGLEADDLFTPDDIWTFPNPEKHQRVLG